MKRLFLSLPILLAAVALYLMGSAAGAIALVIAGLAVEAGVWLALFQHRRQRVRA